MLPAFDLQGGLPLALARACSVAALLSTFGTLVFRRIVAPKAFATMPTDQVSRAGAGQVVLVRASAAAFWCAALGWLGLQAAGMADAESAAQALAAVPTVLGSTRFGHIVMLQGVLMLAIPCVLGQRGQARRTTLALVLAGLATALQAGHGHALSMYDGPSLILLCGIVHLLAAGAWLGGLLPLLMLVREAPPKAGAVASRWFSPLGKLCLWALLATSAYQGWELVASIPGLVGTAYGWMALLKGALFGVLFGFAWCNRHRFAPALLGGDPAGAKRALVRSIGLQTGFGMAVVLVAAVLSGLPPSMHVQPVWPFAERFTLDTVNEDPGFAREVVGAALALAGAAVLVVVAILLRRRVRWLIAAAALAIAGVATPHLDLLFAPAYPTSYYQSPTGLAATAITHGAALYPANCAACHGAAGRGDGVAARTLAAPPADLTAAHLWMHSDGELFWWLAHGMLSPEGAQVMPGFADRLSDDDLWDLIDYIRVHNAGLTFREAGSWAPPIHAPDLRADCLDGRSVALADLRGRFVRIVFGTPPARPDPSVVTILADPAPATVPNAGACVASDPAVAAAYAIASGSRASELPGMQFLIDDGGWLRAVQRPGATPAWNDPRVLAALVRDMRTHPIAGGDHAAMQM